ncbi:uncharacterized protein METZ01_LOCUS162339, partial [marine metagenome]
FRIFWSNPAPLLYSRGGLQKAPGQLRKVVRCVCTQSGYGIDHIPSRPTYFGLKMGGGLTHPVIGIISQPQIKTDPMMKRMQPPNTIRKTPFTI